MTVFAPDVLRDRRLYFYNRTYPVWALIEPAAPGAYRIRDRRHGSQRRSRASSSADWRACSSPIRRRGASGPISHMFGSRPFVNQDDSANNWPVAVFTFGEGLQNNHHAFPGAYRHAMRWWEPDLSGWVIAILAKAGIVWDLQHAGPRRTIDSRLRRNRTVVDSLTDATWTRTLNNVQETRDTCRRGPADAREAAGLAGHRTGTEGEDVPNQRSIRPSRSTHTAWIPARPFRFRARWKKSSSVGCLPRILFDHGDDRRSRRSPQP